MKEAHDAILGVMQKWTIADLVKKPLPSEEIRSSVNCRMAVVCCSHSLG